MAKEVLASELRRVPRVEIACTVSDDRSEIRVTQAALYRKAKKTCRFRDLENPHAGFSLEILNPACRRNNGFSVERFEFRFE